MESSTRNIAWHLAAWPVIAAAAVVNGITREKVYAHAVGKETAGRISAVPLLGAISGISWWLARHRPLPDERSAVAVGGVWLAATEAFEFGLGRLEGKSWEELLHEYNILAGRLWVVVPVVMALAPWFARRSAQA